MKRILIGLIAVALLAAGGWFGFSLYVQHRAAAEVEAAFDRIRNQGSKASHGKVAFDLASRTLTIEDIAIDLDDQPRAQIKIAGIKGAGVRLIDETHFAADSIEISGCELAFEVTEPAGSVKLGYKAPQVTVRDYSGPAPAIGSPASRSVIDMSRFALEQFASASASSIVASSLTFTIDGPPGDPLSGEFTTSGVAVEHLHEGKVDTIKADRLAFQVSLRQMGEVEKANGNASNVVIREFDTGAIASVLDPQMANDDSYHRIYRQIGAGPYEVTTGRGNHTRVESIVSEDIGLRPSKLRLTQFAELFPSDRTVAPTPAQTNEMIEMVASFYEGLRVGNAQTRGISVESPKGSIKMSAMHYSLESGQAELLFEGLDNQAPEGEFRLERFALKSLNAAEAIRLGAQLRQAPTADQALSLFRILSGIEVKGFAAPYQNAKKLLTIDTLSLDWGQLIGSIPSKARLIAKMVVPIDPKNPAQMPIAMAGIDKVAIDLDLGAAWTESSSTFAIAPATVDLGNLAKAQLHFALVNVPHAVFTSDPVQAMDQAAQIDTGAIELSLRDSGVVDLIVAQFARIQNVSRDAARSMIVEMIRAQGEKVAASDLDARPALDAIAGFVETSGQTLTIKLSPRAKAPLTQLMQLLQTDPQSALAQFRIEASTGL